MLWKLTPPSGNSCKNCLTRVYSSLVRPDKYFMFSMYKRECFYLYNYSYWVESIANIFTRERHNAQTHFLAEMEKVLSRLMLVGITSIYMAKGALPTCFDQFCLGQYQVILMSYCGSNTVWWYSDSFEYKQLLTVIYYILNISNYLRSYIIV